MRTALSCLELLFLVAVSAAEEIDATIELGTPVSLTLKGGDLLYGELVARDAKSIRSTMLCSASCASPGLRSWRFTRPRSRRW